MPQQGAIQKPDHKQNTVQASSRPTTLLPWHNLPLPNTLGWLIKLTLTVSGQKDLKDSSKYPA
jgi:hypothetical protein